MLAFDRGGVVTPELSPAVNPHRNIGYRNTFQQFIKTTSEVITLGVNL